MTADQFNLAESCVSGTFLCNVRELLCMDQALGSVDFVVEAASENEGLKNTIFQSLDKVRSQ